MRHYSAVASRQTGSCRVYRSETKATEHTAHLSENADGRQLGSMRRLQCTTGRARSGTDCVGCENERSGLNTQNATVGARDETQPRRTLRNRRSAIPVSPGSTAGRCSLPREAHGYGGSNLPAERAAAGWRCPWQRHACGHSTRKRGANAQVCGVTTRQDCPCGARLRVAHGEAATIASPALHAGPSRSSRFSACFAGLSPPQSVDLCLASLLKCQLRLPSAGCGSPSAAPCRGAPFALRNSDGFAGNFTESGALGLLVQRQRLLGSTDPWCSKPRRLLPHRFFFCI